MDDDAIHEVFAALAPVTIRKLFGGKGIYCEGLIVGIALRGELLLKGDAELGAEYEAAGGRRWTYTGSRHGKLVSMPYWTIPEDALDDADELAIWIRKAFEAARRIGK